MNRYTVVWWPAALDELAKLWLLDRAAVAAASDEADRQLAENPTEWGDEVAPGIRCLETASLRIYFDISPPDRLVSVYMVTSVSGSAE
jgi:hypothetical protein